MKIFRELSLIIMFYLFGEIISYIVQLIIPNLLIPGSLLGMILLLLLLLTKIIKYKWINSISDFFINNMAFFFVPSVVSLLAFLDIITPIFWKLIIILFISFSFTYIMVGLSVKLTIYLQNKKRRKEHE